MADYDPSAIADLLPALSPLDDPDTAVLDRKGTMDKLLGPTTDSTPAWLNTASASDAPPRPIMGRQQAPQSAVPASVTPSGSPSLASNNAGTIGQMQSDYGKASADVQREADQPDLATTTAPLQAQRAKDATPINAYDPQTGKVIDQYKPSFAQRLMRGVGGFARGGVFGAVDPTIGGGQAYGAPNAQYGRDVQQQKARVSSDDQQLKNAADNWKAASDRIKQVAADRRALGAFGKETTDASTDQQKVPILQQNANADTARAYNDSPAGKAEAAKELNEQSLHDRKAQLNDPSNPVSRASNADQAYYMANGKLPEPDRYHAPAELQMFGKAYQAWQGANPGKSPSVEDLRNITSASKGETGGTNLMVPDGKGGFTSTTVRPGDTVPAGSTTVAGMVGNAKSAGKEQQSAQAVVDEADLAHQAAAEASKGNAEGDVDLALSFFKTIKGSNGSGIRFTQQEQSLIKGARNSAGDLQAIAQKVMGGGEMFTPKQRDDVLKIIDIHANAARKHVGDGSSSGTSQPEATHTYNEKTGKIEAVSK